MTKITTAKDLRRTAEQRLRSKKTDSAHPQTLNEAQRLDHELEVLQIELEMQNEELSESRRVADVSLERYIDLYDFAPVGYCTFDREGCVQEANLTLASLLGIERSRLISLRFGQFVADEARPAFAEFLEKVFASQGKEFCELRLNNKGNLLLFVQIEAHTVNSGQECRAAVINISTRKREEEAFHQTRMRLAWVLEKTGTGMWFNKLPFDRLNCDAQTRKLFFIDRDVEPTIDLFWRHLHPDDRKLSRTAINNAIKNHTLFEIEHRALNPATGEIRWIFSAGQATYAPDGTPTNFDGINYDISSRKLVEDELQKVHIKLEIKVLERTKELALSVEFLKKEIAERERAEEGLRRLNRLYAVLSGTGLAITRAGDTRTLFSDVCSIAVEHGAFMLACVGLVDEEQGRMQIVASSGATGYLDDILTTTGKKSGTRKKRLLRHHRHGDTHYVNNDFQHDPCDCFDLDKTNIHGILSSACVALKQDGRVIGALTLYSDEQDFFDQQHVELLVQIGADVSFAIDNITHEASRKKTEQALREETDERLRIAEALLEKEELLLQQSHQAAMGEMINNIAHQWRQPLNFLGLMVQQLPMYYESGLFSKEYLDESANKSMELINHMSRTIDDFRNFFKPDKEKVAFTLLDLVTRTISLIDDSFRSNHIGLKIDARANPVITGFPNEFSQVLLNILMNARDALLDKAPEDARITVTVLKEGERGVVAIADNAGGIAEEVIEKIFEPYYSTKGPDRGTGLGLFMSKNIIEKNMGGRLTVRNTISGAEFKIEV